MHWTALLARRAFPADAQVIDDLACTGCGYNVRGLAASGRCPECGRPVAESLYVVREPDAVASALQAIAYSYLTIFAALLTGIPAAVLGGRGLLWVTMGLAAVGSVVRAVATLDLRRRAGLERLPLIGSRLNGTMLVAVLEACLAVAALVAAFIALRTPTLNRFVGNLVALTLLAWPIVIMTGTLVISRFGSILADLLDYSFVDTEFRVHRVLSVGGVSFMLLMMLVGRPLGGVAGTAMIFVGLAIGLLAVCFGLGYLVVALLHVAGGAQRATESRVDVLGVGESIPPRSTSTPRSAAPDLPDIGLSPRQAD